GTPKVILEFEPIEKLKIDTAYVWYWAASPTDRWNNAGILNTATPAGNANTDGKFGEEYNIRIRYPFPHLKVNIGYAYFRAGSYTEKFKRPGDSHFAYLELSALLFD
ncbi:MAG TPA: alginate export family protein, partial [Turneriella sp.]|nr:alginate export family protein [Turneriella sp.]